MDRKIVAWSGGVLAFLALGAILYLWRLPRETRPSEVSIHVLELAAPLDDPEMEISGLAWWHDQLVLMPQYPDRHGDHLFAIARSAIDAYVDDPSNAEPLEARPVPFDTQGVEDMIEGFDGFEALDFAGHDVYFAVEGDRDETQSAGFAVRGQVVGRLERVVLDPGRFSTIEPQNDLANTGYEALLVQGDRVLALYETNGEVNDAPRVMSFDRELHRSRDIPLQPIEYRVTDATAMDGQGRFWVANYHWPGAPWAPGVCSLTERYGEGESHSRCRTVERLVELRMTDRGISPTNRAPIQLELVDDEHARNWEGVVRLGDRGFLLATDEHPDTILAFVPRPH